MTYESMEEAAEIGKEVRAGVYKLDKIVEIVCEVKANDTKLRKM
jgi:hypothetical protein